MVDKTMANPESYKTNQKKLPVFKSQFALLNVKQGRHALLKKLGYHGLAKTTPVSITITGFLIGGWGEDDGTSRDFSVEVTGVKIL